MDKSGSVEKKSKIESPASEIQSKPSSGPRKSWVLNSPIPPTKPFDDPKSALETSQIVDQRTPEEKKLSRENYPEDPSKIYKVKDNPFVKSNSPNRNSPDVRNSSLSKDKIDRKRMSEVMPVTKKTVEEPLR